MSLNAAQKICCSFLTILLLYWTILLELHLKNSLYNYFYSFLFGLIPLLGGIYSISFSNPWGGLHSTIGKAIGCMSVGLILWGLGSLVWAYYNFFLNISAPYPSLADLCFAPSIFFYGIGVIFLSKAFGIKYAFRDNLVKFFSISIIISVTFISYYLLIILARNGVIVPRSEMLFKSIFDVVYPVGDFFSLTIAILISGLTFNYIGGIYKNSLYMLLVGLILMFVGDFLFSYTTTIGTYNNGDAGDLVLTLGLFFLTIGLLEFTKKINISNHSINQYSRGVGSFEQIALRIINEQENIIGPIAWREANLIHGIKIINKDKQLLEILRTDKSRVIDELASHYENFFGRATRELSNDAIKRSSIRILQNRKYKFLLQKGWYENVSPLHYAQSINIETKELMEYFKLHHKDLNNLHDDNNEIYSEIKIRLANIVMTQIDLANLLDVDIHTIVQEKLDSEETKYEIYRKETVDN